MFPDKFIRLFIACCVCCARAPEGLRPRGPGREGTEVVVGTLLTLPPPEEGLSSALPISDFLSLLLPLSTNAIGVPCLTTGEVPPEAKRLEALFTGLTTPAEGP